MFFVGAMRALPRATAVAIYRRLYWDQPGYAFAAESAPSIAAELFDTAVNMGVTTATGFVQRTLSAPPKPG